jgi:hypothetical protein
LLNWQGNAHHSQLLSLMAGRVRGTFYAQTVAPTSESLENRVDGIINLYGLEVGADLLLSAHFAGLLAPI